MSREVVRRVLLLAAACIPSFLNAQSVEIWKDGAWTVQSPTGSSCGSMPLLQVKGPASIFDAANSPVLAGLEKNLPAALAKVCPGVSDVIVVSGRTRRLMKLAAVAAVVKSEPPPTAAPVAAPKPAVAETPPPPSRRSEPVSTVATPVQASASAATIPMLTTRSQLRSVASASKIEDKCEVLLGWLESSKTEDTPAANYRYRQGSGMLAIFRDEPMTAVFGMSYDKTENRWRLEQHEKVMARCLGITPQRPNAFTHRQNTTLQQYAQQLQQYRPVLDQSFLGQPGPYEPTAISRYVQQVRTQVAWANQAMTSAASAPAVRDAFDRIVEQRQAANSQMALLSSSEKAQVAEYLGRRQSQIAPLIAEEWFREANAAGNGASAVKVLHNSHASLAPVLNSLDASAKAGFEERYKRLAEARIAEPLQTEIAALHAVPASLPGMLQIAAWKTRFDAAFRDLRSFPSVQAAEQEFVQAKARVYTGAFPSWMKEVETIPVDGAAITAKRREMETLFPSREDRTSPVFTQYETPIRAKEDQLRLRVEAEMRKQQQEAAAAAARQSQQVAASNTSREPSLAASTTTGAKSVKSRGGPSPILTASSFSASGLNNEAPLTSIYLGDFAKIGFDPDNMTFVGMYGSYLNSFGRQCDEYLTDRVQIMTQRCTQETVSRNRYGVELSRYCSNWVPEGTGVYADREMYAAKKKLDQVMAGDALRNVGRMMTQKDPIGGAMNMLGTAQAAKADMDAIVEKNGCASPGLKRFEENLRLFALNKRPILLGEQGPKLSAIAPLPGIPFRDQNYTKLVEDLVYEQSKSWVMNRYVQGTVSASVSSRDGQGRPTKISASYTFNGFNGRTQGSVTLNFTDGLPECMYFFDLPATCRTPNRKIVAAYEDGAYPQQ